MKSQVFPIIGTIITKRSSAAFMRTIFFLIVGCASSNLYNLIAMWLFDLAFMLDCVQTDLNGA